MKTLSMLFKKSALVALVAALLLAALPIVNVSASGLADLDNPPADTSQVSSERLERAWVRLQQAYEHQGQMLDHADQKTEKIQNLIDRMEENGKDATALQAALDTFEDAIKEAHPIYESAKGIINSHQGFDADGEVTDHEKAVETVKDLGKKLGEVREIAGEPGKVLREAIKAFRDTRRPTDAANMHGWNLTTESQRICFRGSVSLW